MLRYAALLLSLTFASTVLIMCDDGPVEEAGEDIDETIEDVTGD